MKVLVFDILDLGKDFKAINNVKKIFVEKIDNPYRFEAIHLYEDTHEDQPLDENLLKRKIDEADKIIISGSIRSTYEDFHWKPKMEKTVELILDSGKPTYAVCFGAQYVAQHLGGKVIKNPNGTEFGSVDIYLTEEGKNHPFLDGFHQAKKVHATHNDRVETLPEGVVLLAYNNNSHVQAYQYKNIFATQFHPDIPTEGMRDLLAMRLEKYRESGLIKDDAHLEELQSTLHLGEDAYEILRRFLEHG